MPQLWTHHSDHHQGCHIMCHKVEMCSVLHMGIPPEYVKQYGVHHSLNEQMLVNPTTKSFPIS
jgi:hypothetical protein